MGTSTEFGEVRDGSASDDLRLAIDTARAAIAQEFQITERLDGKSRNLLLVAATWFSAVQAVAGIVLRPTSSGSSQVTVVEWWGYVAVIGLAAGSAAALIWLITVLYRGVWRTRPEEDITAAALRQMPRRIGEPTFATDVLRHHAAILQSRRENNGQRAAALGRAVVPWALSMIAALAQLGVALAALAVTAHDLL